MTAHPPIVDRDSWLAARAELLAEEKRYTRELDALAARRRRLPMHELPGNHTFAGPDGTTSLLDLFGEHDQLVVYLFMNVGPGKFCPGCTNFTNQVGHVEGLAEHGASWATISDMPIEQMQGYWAENGWTMPYASSAGTSFSHDIGSEGGFMLTTLLRVGDKVYQTYTAESRGVDRMMFLTTIADVLAYGRQEKWEDSPQGWPQH